LLLLLLQLLIQAKAYQLYAGNAGGTKDAGCAGHTQIEQKIVGRHALLKCNVALLLLLLPLPLPLLPLLLLQIMSLSLLTPLATKASIIDMPVPCHRPRWRQARFHVSAAAAAAGVAAAAANMFS